MKKFIVFFLIAFSVASVLIAFPAAIIIQAILMVAILATSLGVVRGNKTKQ